MIIYYLAFAVKRYRGTVESPEREITVYLQGLDELHGPKRDMRQRRLHVCMCVTGLRNISETDDSHELHHCRWEYQGDKHISITR